MNQQILNGWKEISGYVKRGIRTTQRWEARLGMPVHRLARKGRNVVVAFSDELDGWISRRSPSPEPLLQMQNNMSSLVWHTAELASQTRTLEEQLRRSLETHQTRIASRIRPRMLAPARHPTGVLLPFRSRTRSSRSNGYAG
jgi:hypothetical protein